MLLEMQTPSCYCRCSRQFFLLSFGFLFHFLTKIFTRFSSLETSAIDMKLVTPCAEWSQFVVQHFSANLT